MSEPNLLLVIKQIAEILEVLVYHNASNYSDVLDRKLKNLTSLILEQELIDSEGNKKAR